MNFVDDVNMLRDEIREKDGRVQDLQKHDVFTAPIKMVGENEMRANIQLAHRHLEDARMRLGKAIQAFEGRDIFDVPAVAAAIEESRESHPRNRPS